MPESIEIEHGGVRLTLTGDPAVVWNERSTLIVADVHLGKTASFRESGVPVPEATTGHDLARLTAALERSGATRLMILGDFVHSRAWSRDETRTAVERWRGSLTGTEIVCVRGNHDRAAGSLPTSLDITEVEEPCREGGLTLVHEPLDTPEPALGGHLHPAVRLRGRVRGSGLRCSCFWKRAGTLVLPAFGSFTGGMPIDPGCGDAIWATNEGRVVRV